MIVDTLLFLVGVLISAFLAFLQHTDAISIGWVWVFSPIIIFAGVVTVTSICVEFN